MQRIKLIFATRLRGQNTADSKLPFKVSVKNDWVYNLDKEPESTIGYTLKKYKIAENDEEEVRKAKKFRAYRIREDPKTRYRYVTEILSCDEAKSLVNKKWALILICEKSIVKDPAEDFKLILDEGERKMLEKFDQDDDKSQKSDKEEQESEGTDSSKESSQTDKLPAAHRNI